MRSEETGQSCTCGPSSDDQKIGLDDFIRHGAAGLVASSLKEQEYLCLFELAQLSSPVAKDSSHGEITGDLDNFNSGADRETEASRIVNPQLTPRRPRHTLVPR